MEKIVYNITVKVGKSIDRLWLQWLTKEIAPEMIGTRCFTKFTLLKLLDLDDAEGNTYAVQFFSKSQDDYEQYMKSFGGGFIEKSRTKWGEQTISFETVMQVVDY